VNHPILMLGIRVGCGVELVREYTLLMAPAVELPTAQPAPASPAPAAHPSAPVSGLHEIAPGETLATIAESLHPGDRRLQQRFVRRAVAANPELFRGEPDPASMPLPAGTVLAMPKSAGAGMPAAPARRTEVRSTRARPPASELRKRGQDRLSIAGSEAAYELRLDAGLDLTRMQAVTDRRRELLRNEQRLLATLADQIAMQLTLAEKIRLLEGTLAQLQGTLREVDVALAASPPAAPAPQPQHSAPPTATPSPAAGTQVPARPPPPQPAASAETMALGDWLLLALLGGGVLAVLLFLRAQSSRTRERLAPADADADAAAQPQPVVLDPHEAPATEVAKPRPAPVEQPRPPAPAEPLIDVAEHESALELAEIMLSFGRVQGAAQTLADYIEANPKQAVRPWLKLLDVYRQAGMRAEFDTLAQRLNQTFNVEVLPWDDAGRHRFADSLEGYPHLMEAITRAWDTPGCADYLTHLMRDNREGTRAGFPLSVLHELLLLLGIAEARQAALDTIDA
jgi:hypothetical protein